MGHVELPPSVARKKRREALKKLALSTGVILSLGSVGIIRGLPYLPKQPEPQIIELSPYTQVHIPEIAATSTSQGTLPIADGAYVHFASISHARTGEVVKEMEAYGLRPVVEAIGEGKDRLLVPYKVEDLDSIMATLGRIDPTSKPMLLSKDQGVDRFQQYERRTNDPHLSVLEKYCLATNGKLERMPYYDAVHRAAQHAIAVDHMDSFGYTEETWMYKLYAHMNAESKFNPEAESNAGAKGLMQLMPGTVKWIFGSHRHLQPEQNIEAGSEALARFHYFAKNEMHIKNTQKQKTVAVRAYNFGPGNVMNGMDTKETRDYVIRVSNGERLMAQYFGR